MLDVVHMAFRLVVNNIIAFAVLVVAGAGAVAISAVCKAINHFAKYLLLHSFPLQELLTTDSIQQINRSMPNTKL